MVLTAAHCTLSRQAPLTHRNSRQPGQFQPRTLVAAPGVLLRGKRQRFQGRQQQPLRSLAGGGNDGVGSGGIGGGGSGGDGDGNGDSGSGGWEALLLAAGKDAKALPPALLAALKKGQVSADVLKRYLHLENNPLFRLLMKMPGFRDRLLADESFIVKLGIELGIGLVCKLAAEKEKRRGAFAKEIDFVFANVIMALIADFMLTWLPAPSLNLSGGSGGGPTNGVSRFFASCPDNAFQVKPADVSHWSLAQRGGAVLRNGTKLLGVGFFASLFGVSITNVLVKARTMLDPDFKVLNPPQNVVNMSAAYATYMASSSNLRYQIIAGVIEERAIERFLGGSPALCHVLSFLIRTANTFVGSLLWVDYLRLIGLQKKKEA